MSAPLLAWDAASLLGPRDENQDNYLVIAAGPDGRGLAHWLEDGIPRQAAAPGWPAHRARLALLDGMGGHRRGREIAEAAVAALRELPPVADAGTQRRETLALHQRLFARFHAGHARSPGTTLVWAELDLPRRRASLVHVGDSRAYLRSAGSGEEDADAWRQLTRDHVPAEFGWRDGRIDAAAYAEQSRFGGQRLVQALGYGGWGVKTDAEGNATYGFLPELRIDTPETLPPHAADHSDLLDLELRPGDLLLLASDGLWSAALDGRWQGPAQRPRAALGLAEAALAAGGEDNVTLLFAALDGPSPEAP